MIMFILSYVLGKKSNQNYLEMANLAKDQYKKDNTDLLREQQLKEMRDRRAKKKADAAKKTLEDEKNKRLEKLERIKASPDKVFKDIGIKKNENNK
jgi:hypothetical protein